MNLIPIFILTLKNNLKILIINFKINSLINIKLIFIF